MMTAISDDLARRVLVYSQGYTNQWELPPDKEGTASLVDRLGFVQIDTILVTQRAHHHIIWSRQPHYVPRMIEELQWPDRRVFESFGGIACFLPMNEFRYYFPRPALEIDDLDGTKECGWWDSWASNDVKWFRQWYYENRRFCRQVYRVIEENGPSGSSDLAALTSKGSGGGWWQFGPVRSALAILHRMGLLMIKERKNFRRIYDLQERVLPPGIDTTRPSKQDAARFRLKRALDCMGLIAEDDVLLREIDGKGNPLREADNKEVRQALHELLHQGKLVRVDVENTKGTHYAISSVLEDASHTNSNDTVVLLSPFDPLILWRGDRKHLRRYFHCGYSPGIYTKPYKRRFGYYGLPILWRDMIIGFVDAKAERKSRCLMVHILRIDKIDGKSDELISALSLALKEFYLFNDCNNVVFDKVDPEWLKQPLEKHCAKIGKTSAMHNTGHKRRGDPRA